MKKSVLSALVVALTRASPLNPDGNFQGELQKREVLQKRGYWTRLWRNTRYYNYYGGYGGHGLHWGYGGYW